MNPRKVWAKIFPHEECTFDLIYTNGAIEYDVNEAFWTAKKCYFWSRNGDAKAFVDFREEGVFNEGTAVKKIIFHCSNCNVRLKGSCHGYLERSNELRDAD